LFLPRPCVTVTDHQSRSFTSPNLPLNVYPEGFQGRYSLPGSSIVF
jgi:hypothetical protein